MPPTLAIRGSASGDVFVEDERIMPAPPAISPARTLDATGCRVVAGFVDLQCNGAFGVDFTSGPKDAHEAAARLPETGVTSFLPTVISAPAAATRRAIAELHGLRCASSGARSLGVHLEGPFHNPVRRGAHARQHLRLPDRDEAAAWSAAGGVALVTLAPELDGALELVADLVGRGVVVCCGHCEVSASELHAAVAAGVTGATHLFNAMGSLSARSPGTAGAVLAAPTLMAGIIVDGLHVDPAMVAIAWRALGSGRLFLVTDAVAALGLADGSFQIGDVDVLVDETGVHTADGVLAGSVLRMDVAVRNLMAFTGCTIEAAVAAASATPARLLGRRDVGVIEPGAYGDIVLLDDSNHVVATVVGGSVVHDPQQRASR
ncbi:MAG: N-acetylglucosamine-6-phosphate deacetylase [Ilumatobacteraceae bacterium]